MKYWLPLLLTGWMSVAHAGLFGDDELLPPDEAFAFKASVDAEGRIRADWKIADGYYLYKDKFIFNAGNNGISLGEANFPPAKVKEDPIFGKVETYRKKVNLSIPVTRQPGAGNLLSFTATYQGCADIGVCYPPQTKTVSLQLPDAPASNNKTAAANSALGALNALGASFDFGDDSELLPPDEAFRLDVLVKDADHIAASWVIARDYYLYRDKFEFALEAADGITLLPVQMPEGEHKNDEFFGDIQVFHEVVDVGLGLRREAGAATPVTLIVKYQGCAEAGVCYQPMSKRIELMLPPADGSSAAAVAVVNAGPAESAPAPDLSEQDAIARRLMDGNLIATLLAFYGFGLLLSFTPCVFPMIPILSSIIVGQGASITTRKSFTLSLVYVLAMASTYTLAGVVAAQFGENLQAIFQNVWLLGGFAAVFVLLSLSMFGFYELQMPSFIQNKLSGVSNRQKGGSLTGVAVMGFLSALIVGPCVAAPLAGALIYIGQTGDAVLGGLALFTLSMGMGTPLIAIGVGAGKLLPKAGVWMDRVKAVFGVLMLAVAIWLLERVLPPSLTLTLWASLLLMSSVYLGALDGLPVEATGWSRLWKGLGLLSLVYGVLLLIGAASGGSDPLRPLANVSGGGSGQAIATQAHEVSFKPIHSLADLQRELDAAVREGKPVMVDFYADWCISCKEMEKYTFGNARVQQVMEGFVLLQADVTANNADDKALLKHFGLFGPPGILFFDASGKERPELSVVGFKKADAFLQIIKRVEGR
ncbi:Cytochrome c-type biogenesis protein DsbD, protein-disulfide reductase [hydrothermal vent metagenome]|uniref:Thiol:disulfide interchange protein DsbD n=1 Tax=hydrothermal vent metagenome TaxID=652676 RepID=A0A3B0Y2E2_9ZZZZ